MTEKEIAEEYYYKTYPVTLNIGEEERKKEVTDIFLAGLKAGKPKWHKVKSGDLPPEDTKVLAFMAGGEVCIAHFYRKNVWDKIGIVIAWCEIPQCKDKE